jgi:hypothetical protein
MPYAHKNMKEHKEPIIYTLTDDDMYRIGYQVEDYIDEVVQQVS